MNRLASAALGLAAALVGHAAFAQTGPDLVVTGPRNQDVPQWVKFCEDYGQPLVCRPTPGKTAVITMTAQRRKDIDRVNRDVNRRIALRSDPDQWGWNLHRYVYNVGRPSMDVDKWDRGRNLRVGDCEDYALEKQRIFVEEMGFPRSAVLVTRVLAFHKRKGFGHIVLTLSTSDGDYILDAPNFANNMKRWWETGIEAPHVFQYRQSVEDPGAWAMLGKPGNIDGVRDIAKQFRTLNQQPSVWQKPARAP